MPETATDAGATGTAELRGDADEQRRGRPRSEQCDRAIEAAVLDLVVEHGFGGMSIEGVAARAGVAKTTIYRRWNSKEALVVDAFMRRARERVVSPDTGRLRTDLIEMLRALLRNLQLDGGLMQAFIAEQRRHPQLADAFRSTFLKERRAVIRAVLGRGVDRGELPESADLELLADVGAAVLWYRLMITGAPLDDDLPERIVDQFFPAPSEPLPARRA
jgi:AcrR family transcriptional regulator